MLQLHNDECMQDEPPADYDLNDLQSLNEEANVRACFARPAGCLLGVKTTAVEAGVCVHVVRGVAW